MNSQVDANCLQVAKGHFYAEGGGEGGRSGAVLSVNVKVDQSGRKVCLKLVEALFIINIIFFNVMPFILSSVENKVIFFYVVFYIETLKSGFTSDKH